MEHQLLRFVTPNVMPGLSLDGKCPGCADRKSNPTAWAFWISPNIEMKGDTFFAIETWTPSQRRCDPFSDRLSRRRRTFGKALKMQRLLTRESRCFYIRGVEVRSGALRKPLGKLADSLDRRADRGVPEQHGVWAMGRLRAIRRE